MLELPYGCIGTEGLLKVICRHASCSLPSKCLKYRTMVVTG